MQIIYSVTISKNEGNASIMIMLWFLFKLKGGYIKLLMNFTISPAFTIPQSSKKCNNNIIQPHSSRLSSLMQVQDQSTTSQDCYKINEPNQLEIQEGRRSTKE
jgi:hypothetical protein